VNISKSKDTQVDKKKSRKILTTSKSRNLVEAPSDGFLSLNAPLISISKCLFYFLPLGRRCLSRLLSNGLGGSGNIPGLSSASRDAMQALAIDKASAAGKRDKESQINNRRKANEIGRRHNSAKSLP
jgi:hypothetical protein